MHICIGLSSCCQQKCLIKENKKSGLKFEFISESVKELWKHKVLDLGVLGGTWNYHISNNLSGDANVAIKYCCLEVHPVPSHLYVQCDAQVHIYSYWLWQSRLECISFSYFIHMEYLWESSYCPLPYLLVWIYPSTFFTSYKVFPHTHLIPVAWTEQLNTLIFCSLACLSDDAFCFSLKCVILVKSLDSPSVCSVICNNRLEK